MQCVSLSRKDTRTVTCTELCNVFAYVPYGCTEHACSMGRSCCVVKCECLCMFVCLELRWLVLPWSLTCKVCHLLFTQAEVT